MIDIRGNSGIEPGEGRILIVRHGDNRGRIPDFMHPAFRYIADYHAGLSRHLILHETGSWLPALDEVRAVVFLLADPLQEFYPKCYEEALGLARWARDRNFPVINPPEVLSNSVKSVQAKLWADSGIPTPHCERFECREELIHILHSKESKQFPVLIRGDWEHAQNGMRLCRGIEEARAIPAEALVFPGVVTPFIDTRESYRAAGRRDVWSRLHHTKRVYVFGDVLMANHIHFSDEPIVASGNSTFAGLRACNPGVRRVMKYRKPYWDSLRAEWDFVTGELEQPELMLKAARALGLGYLAIDYASHADGSVVLWEANPYPPLPAWRKAMLPGERQIQAKYNITYERFASFLCSLLGATASRNGNARPDQQMQRYPAPVSVGKSRA